MSTIPSSLSTFLHELLLRDISGLRGKCITMAGVGALGTWTADFLARVGANTFRLIDKERVEEHNLSTQLHYRALLGATKVSSFGRHLYNHYKARAEYHAVELNVSNARALLGASDLVICTFDNHKGRQLVQDICLQQRIPCIFGGMNGEHFYGHIAFAENYINPPDPPHLIIDPCNYPLAVSLVTATSSYLAEAAIRFLLDGERRKARFGLLEVLR